MLDCSIRVTALLECFEWTSNKSHNRTGSIASTKKKLRSGQYKKDECWSLYSSNRIECATTSLDCVVVILNCAVG